MLTCMIAQFVIIKYAGKVLYVTELSFKENLFCLVIGSFTLFSNIVIQMIMPEHFYLCTRGIEIGRRKFYWKREKSTDE